MFDSCFSATAARRPLPRLLLAVSLVVLGGLWTAGAPAVRAAEPLVVMSHAVPAASLLRQAKALGRQPQNTPVEVALSLPLRNQSALKALIRSLYNPKDALYGKYLTSSQFTQRFSPTQDDYTVVAAFARSHGLTTHLFAGRTLVAVSGTSGAVERAFNVRLNQYRMPDGRVAYANDVAPSLPATVAGRLSAIIGLDNLIIPHHNFKILPGGAARDALSPIATRATIGSDQSGGLTPTDIKKIYNLNNIGGLAGEGETVALVEPGGGFRLGDIGAYVSKFNLPTNAGVITTIPVSGYTGSVFPGDGEIETVLDIDMVLALAPRVKRIFVYVSPELSTADILAALTQVTDDDYAQTASASLGISELGVIANSNGSLSLEQDQFNSIDAVLQRMAAQGQSMFAASGDQGAYTGGVLSVGNPADDPYITAVGGTTLSVKNPGTATISYTGETTWDDATNDEGSGGGISVYFGKPFYQYQDPLSLTGPIGDSADPNYNPFGSPARDVPDVSLDADPNTGYAIYVGDLTNPTDGTYPNNFTVVGGTSAASPLWAAFAALVNENRALGGSSPTTGVDPGLPTHLLGFANPLIYAIGTGQYGNYGNDFHDIANGSTNGFGAKLPGYPATIGYDDATGWGSFNGANLLHDMAAAASGGTGSSVSAGGPAATVSGTVAFDGGTPPTNVVATVTAVSSDGVTRGTTTTAADGTYTLSVPSGLTYTLSADAPGYVGQSFPNIAVPATGTSKNFSLTDVTTAGANQFAPGLQMISAPFDFSSTGADFAGLFGLTTPLQSGDPKLIAYLQGAYVVYPTPPADTLRPGIGYWLDVPTGGAYLHRQGQIVPSPFEIVLQAGWNIIGDPFTTAVPFSSITIATDSANATAKPLTQSSALVSPTLYTYPPNNGSYIPVTDAVQPYVGYWVYASQAVYLTFNSAGNSGGGLPPPP